MNLHSSGTSDNIIAFTRLGKMGRLGNQIFQYAFVRLTAQHLGVKFYCPAWKGQNVFLLHDDGERTSAPLGIKKVYPQDGNLFLGFHPDALNIEKGVDIQGYFMSDKYFSDKNLVRSWFVFNTKNLIYVTEKYKNIDFSKSCALHLRFTDMSNVARIHVPGKSYYQKALQSVRKYENILVFSDDISSAKKFLKGFKYQFIFMANNKDYEDLYLISKCHACICSVSSFSWWGAWLNVYPDKLIIYPKQRYTIGAPLQNKDFWPDDWMGIDSGRRFWHLYVAKKIKISCMYFFSRGLSRLKILLRRG